MAEKQVTEQAEHSSESSECLNSSDRVFLDYEGGICSRSNFEDFESRTSFSEIHGRIANALENLNVTEREIAEIRDIYSCSELQIQNSFKEDVSFLCLSGRFFSKVPFLCLQAKLKNYLISIAVTALGMGIAVLSTTLFYKLVGVGFIAVGSSAFILHAFTSKFYSSRKKCLSLMNQLHKKCLMNKKVYDLNFGEHVSIRYNEKIDQNIENYTRVKDLMQSIILDESIRGSEDVDMVEFSKNKLEYSTLNSSKFNTRFSRALSFSVLNLGTDDQDFSSSDFTNINKVAEMCTCVEPFSILLSKYTSGKPETYFSAAFEYILSIKASKDSEREKMKEFNAAYMLKNAFEFIGSVNGSRVRYFEKMRHNRIYRSGLKNTLELLGRVDTNLYNKYDIRSIGAIINLAGIVIAAQQEERNNKLLYIAYKYIKPSLQDFGIYGSLSEDDIDKSKDIQESIMKIFTAKVIYDFIYSIEKIKRQDSSMLLQHNLSILEKEDEKNETSSPKEQGDDTSKLPSLEYMRYF